MTFQQLFDRLIPGFQQENVENLSLDFLLESLYLALIAVDRLDIELDIVDRGHHRRMVSVEDTADLLQRQASEISDKVYCDVSCLCDRVGLFL